MGGHGQGRRLGEAQAPPRPRKSRLLAPWAGPLLLCASVWPLAFTAPRTWGPRRRSPVSLIPRFFFRCEELPSIEELDALDNLEANVGAEKPLASAGSTVNGAVMDLDEEDDEDVEDDEDSDTAWEEDLAALLPFYEVPNDRWFRGRVSRAESYGIFVTLEATDTTPAASGLVHPSRMDHNMLPVKAHFTEGQEVSVQLAEVDRLAQRLSLSLESEGVQEAQGVADFLCLPDHEWLQGVVKMHVPFGVMVNVEATETTPENSGLVHHSEMAVPSTTLEIGRKVIVRVKKVDLERDLLSFTMMEEVDWGQLQTASRAGTFVATVLNVQSNHGSMLVVADVNRQLVHTTMYGEPAGRGRLGVADREVAAGDTLFVRIVSVDAESKELELRVVEEEFSVSFPPAAGQEDAGGAVEEEVAGGAEGQVLEAVEASGDVESFDGFNSLGPACQAVIRRYEERLLDQGYDGVDVLQMLSAKEWAEMKAVCKVLPGHAAQLRVALQPDGPSS